MVAWDIFQVFTTSASSLNFNYSVRDHFGNYQMYTHCNERWIYSFLEWRTDEHLYYGLVKSSALNVKIPITAISSSLTKVLTTWAVVIELYYPINGIIHIFRQKNLNLYNTCYRGRDITNDTEDTIWTSVQCKWLTRHAMCNVTLRRVCQTFVAVEKQ